MDNCIFCKIANGDIPSKTIYEDKIVKVYLDINPYGPGHTLIIPKDHYTNLDDIDEKVLSHIMVISKKIKKLIDERLKPDGIKVVQNNGCLQDIKHFHLHLLPDCNVPEKSLDEVFDLLTK